MSENINDYLEKGMYGIKEPNALEKKRYLGTYRERVVIAMTKMEVVTNRGLTFLEEKMGSYPEANLLLNGALDYASLRPYIMLSERKKIPFSIVGYKEKETDIYLVLACPKEIDLPDIHLTARDLDSSVKKEDADQKTTTLLEKIKQLFQ